MDYSNHGFPANLAEILLNSEVFEVCFADRISQNLDRDALENYFKILKPRKKKVFFNSDYVDFAAHDSIKEIKLESRQRLASSLVEDIEIGGEPSRCWTPHHGIRATCKDNLIEVAVCFICGWYRGEMLGERFYGFFPSEEKSKSKMFFDEIFSEQILENR